MNEAGDVRGVDEFKGFRILLLTQDTPGVGTPLEQADGIVPDAFCDIHYHICQSPS